MLFKDSRITESNEPIPRRGSPLCEPQFRIQSMKIREVNRSRVNLETNFLESTFSMKKSSGNDLHIHFQFASPNAQVTNSIFIINSNSTTNSNHNQTKTTHQRLAKKQQQITSSRVLHTHDTNTIDNSNNNFFPKASKSNFSNWLVQLLP